MLDPLTALGLAGNLIQVIQFSYDIVSEGNKIHNDSGTVLSQNKTAEEVATDLSELTQNLKVKQEEWRVAHGCAALEPDETRLRKLCDRCVEVAFELQIQLNKLKAKDGRANRLKSYKQALISVWRKDAIEEIADRLKRYQQELDTRVLLGIRQSLQEADVRNADQFTTLDQRTKALTVAVLDHNGNFHTKLDHHTDLLVQIAAGQIKTHEMLQAVACTARTPSPAPPAYHQVMPAIPADPSGSSPLHIASKDGHTAQLRQLLGDPSIDVNVRDEYGCTPLHVAVNANSARYLMRAKGIDYDAEDNAGRTALHCAVLKRRLDVVRVLLSKSVDKEWKDGLGKTALFYAQECPAAKFMLRYGTEVEAKTTDQNNNTALIHLAWLGDKEGAEFYLDEGADLDARNDLGDTALIVSARRGNVDFVRWALQAHADVHARNHDSLTPLFVACEQGHSEVTTLLLEAGARHQMKCPSGWTPLAMAATRGHNDCVKALLAYGADPNLGGHYGTTPAAEACYHGHPKMLKQFIEAGANIEATNSMGLTLLGIAAYRGQDDCVQLLVDAGAKLETRGSKQNQPK